MGYAIGIDVGGTTSTVAVGDAAHQVVHLSNQFDSRTWQGPEKTIEAISNEILTSLDAVEVDPKQVRSIGLATPGPATFDGVLLKTVNLDAKLWDRYPIRQGLEARIRDWSDHASVHYIGDGQAAALGEFSVRTGAIRWDRVPLERPPSPPLSSLFMVIVGTGLGGGEVREGQVVRGRQGRAGHAGHVLLPDYAFRYEHDRQLVVGNATHTAESAISLTALTHQLEYRLTLDAWREHPLVASSQSSREKAKQLRGLAAEGDPLALELFQDQARALGITLLAVNYLGDYDRLVIGGGVCDLADHVREEYRRTAEQTYREFALDGFRDLDHFEYSVCGDEAPVIGALAYAASQSPVIHRD